MRSGTIDGMSVVFDRAQVSMLMADYAVSDGLGKLQVIGGGLQVLGRDPKSGTTAAFALVVSMSFPPELYLEQYAFEVVLEDESGAPVTFPGHADGAPVVRFGQNLQIEEPHVPGSGLPRRTLPARMHLVIHFNTGLPLPPGRALHWRVRIDGDSKPHWVHPFFVAAPPTGPVLG